MAARDVIHGITTHSDALTQEQEELHRSLMQIEEAAADLLSGQHRACIENLLGQAFWRWQLSTELAHRHPPLAAWFKALYERARAAQALLLHLWSPHRRQTDPRRQEAALIKEIDHLLRDVGHCMMKVLEEAGVEARRLHDDKFEAPTSVCGALLRAQLLYGRAANADLRIPFSEFSSALDGCFDPERSPIRHAVVEARNYDLSWAAEVGAGLGAISFTSPGSWQDDDFARWLNKPPAAYASQSTVTSLLVASEHDHLVSSDPADGGVR
ncbi:MAG: hypothetical protein RLZZ450_854 [Pseudomonadota bacterium]|jgi:hypothetical protein